MFGKQKKDSLLPPRYKYIKDYDLQTRLDTRGRERQTAVYKGPYFLPLHSDETFRMLFVSTEIPSSLVKQEYLKIENVQVKIGDAATQSYTDVDVSGTYARIILIDEYNRGDAPFGYTVPGPNSSITVTFTVTGLTD